jgi:hypothetical protein
LLARRVGERCAPAKGPATTQFVCLLFGHSKVMKADEIGGCFSMDERNEALWPPAKAVFVSDYSTA